MRYRVLSLTHYERIVGSYLWLELADALSEGSQHTWTRRNLEDSRSATHSDRREINGTQLAQYWKVGTAVVRNRRSDASVPGGVRGRGR